MKKAFLYLEDGTVFQGQSIGADREVVSEIVFNTSMTGYLEVLTDPSYAGQAVTMTYPLIGNYGICYEDMESGRPWLDGFIVRELSRLPSNFRSEDTIQHFLEKYDIPGISGIDTRTLTKILREKGTMNGMITTTEYKNAEDILPRIKAYTTGKVVEKVTCKEKYVLRPGDIRGNADIEIAAERVRHEQESEEEELEAGKSISLAAGAGAQNMTQEEDRAAGAGDTPDCDTDHAADPAGTSESPLKVALLDLGAKRNIARNLVKRGCVVTVYPALTTAGEILADHPDGIMLSNGPGDPKECTSIIEEIRKLYESDIPIFAICLGHQLMALAAGADTHKLKYGHRGGNHPVKDLRTGRVYISSQNHGYVVDTDHLDPNVAVPAFINVNDGTNEGLEYIGKNIFTVQFHPEACPGPQDSGYLFDRFIRMMKGQKGTNAGASRTGVD